ncbi:hypothetical protein ACFE04_008942 [Oxalis oulophora]
MAAEKNLYDTMLARSFSKHEQKKLGYGALIACFLFTLSLCTIFKPYLVPLTVDLNLRLTMGVAQKMMATNDKILEISKNNLPEDGLTIDSENLDKSQMQIVKISSINNEILAVNDHTSSNNQETLQAVNETNTIDIAELEPILKDSRLQNVTSDVRDVPKKTELMCNMEGSRTDYCEIINGDIRIDSKSASVFVSSSDLQTENSTWKIRPYARKGDVTAMDHVREWSVVKKSDQLPICTQTHNVPAIIFSNGGYAGNNFHDYTDVVIPLYLTARQFKGEVKFLVTDKREFWLGKFSDVIKSLSNYEIIDIDNEQSTIHCFESVIVGLKRPHGDKELTIYPSKSPDHSMKDFRKLIRSSYSLKRNKAIKLRDGSRKRPQLLIVARKRTRAFTNVGSIAKMAKRLGFRVIVSELGMNVTRTAELVNSCDVMLGVHGAGLTNIVFLPENAVLIQVVPFGGFEWLAKYDFEEPSKGMDLKYLEYKIDVQESTLIKQYPPNDVVLTDPGLVNKNGWETFKTIYLEKQNVNVDISRFRDTLVKALELLHK